VLEHDGQVGELLKKLDDLGIANNTIVIIVICTTDNGAEVFSWPDGGATPVPWREEHQLGRRLPETALTSFESLTGAGTALSVAIRWRCALQLSGRQLQRRVVDELNSPRPKPNFRAA